MTWGRGRFRSHHAQEPPGEGAQGAKHTTVPKRPVVPRPVFASTMLNRPVTIKDDRGHDVPLINTGAASAGPGSRAHAVLQAALPTTLGRRLGMNETAFCCTIGFLVLGNVALSFTGMPRMVASGVAAAATVPVALYARRRASMNERVRTRAALLDASLCASCGYDLTGTEPGNGATEKFVRCPECGSCWRTSLADGRPAAPKRSAS
jgi:hypothetical protein